MTASFASSAPLYWPLTENEVVSTCTGLAVIPKICRARLAIPANSLVRSWAYNQSSVRPKQSTLSHLGGDSWPQQVFDGFVGEERRHQVYLPEAFAYPIQNHGDGRCSYTHRVFDSPALEHLATRPALSLGTRQPRSPNDPGVH